MNEIILTHCGKLGDMLYSLPVGSWLYQRWGRRIHWVLPQGFGPFRYIEPLLMAQDMTAAVTLVDHQITDFSCGGQPYKFDPATHGITGEYYNLGFRSYPGKFLSAFYAEEHGLAYDSEFTLDIGEKIRESGDVLRSSELAMQILMPDVEPLPTSVDLLYLAKKINGAREFHCWFCGIAVLCWMARIPAHVYRVSGHAGNYLYFPKARTLTFHELKVHPKDMARSG